MCVTVNVIMPVAVTAVSNCRISVRIQVYSVFKYNIIINTIMANTFTKILSDGTTGTVTSSLPTPPITAPEARLLVEQELAKRAAAKQAALDAFNTATVTSTTVTAVTNTFPTQATAEDKTLLNTMYRKVRSSAGRAGGSVTVYIPPARISQLRAVLENNGFTVNILTGNQVSYTFSAGNTILDNIRISW